MCVGSLFQAVVAAIENEQMTLGAWYLEISSGCGSTTWIGAWLAEFCWINRCRSMDNTVHKQTQCICDPCVNG